MDVPFLQNIDGHYKQLKNWVMGKVTTPKSDTVEGAIWYNETSKRIGVDVGSEKKELAYVGEGHNSLLDKDGGDTVLNYYGHVKQIHNTILENFGNASGVIVSDANNYIPIEQIPVGLLGGLTPKGAWNPATNTPTLSNPPLATTRGWFYIASTSGTALGTDWASTDWCISDGTVWQKIDNTDKVSSVFGRTGNVVAASGDYNLDQVNDGTTYKRITSTEKTNYNTAYTHSQTTGNAHSVSASQIPCAATGDVSATNIQSAIAELASDKLSTTTAASAYLSNETALTDYVQLKAIFGLGQTSKLIASAANNSAAQGWTKLYSWSPAAYNKRHIMLHATSGGRGTLTGIVSVSFMQEANATTISNANITSEHIAGTVSNFSLIYNTATSMIELWYNDIFGSNQQTVFSPIKISGTTPTAYYGVSQASLPAYSTKFNSIDLHVDYLEGLTGNVQTQINNCFRTLSGITATTDLNTVTTPGSYRLYSNVPFSATYNQPVGAFNFGQLRVFTGENGQIYQEYTPNSYDDTPASCIYHRIKFAVENGWSIWRRGISKGELDSKQNTLIFDNAPTVNSANPVTSNGINNALFAKVDKVAIGGIWNYGGVGEGRWRGVAVIDTVREYNGGLFHIVTSSRGVCSDVYIRCEGGYNAIACSDFTVVWSGIVRPTYKVVLSGYKAYIYMYEGGWQQTSILRMEVANNSECTINYYNYDSTVDPGSGISPVYVDRLKLQYVNNLTSDAQAQFNALPAEYVSKTVTGTQSIASSLNTSSAHVGGWASNTLFARFGHINYNLSTGFGFLQTDDGTCYIDVPSSKPFYLRVNGVVKNKMDANGYFHFLTPSLSDDTDTVPTTEWVKDVAAPIFHASSSNTYGVSTASVFGHSRASSSTPTMNGTGNAGTDNGYYAREGHVHPTDTSRAASSHTHGNITNAGAIGTTSGLPVVTSTNGVLTAAAWSTTNPNMDGTASVGSSTVPSRSDHVHPSDTSRLAIGSGLSAGTQIIKRAWSSSNTYANGYIYLEY